jgi:hypothetical protein
MGSGDMRRFLCFVFGHRWGPLETNQIRQRPESWPSDEMFTWVMSDYDLYKSCERCDKWVGVGQRYD